MAGRARPGWRWWRRLVGWLRARLVPLRRALPPPSLERRWGEGAAALPDDLREELGALTAERGAVREVVAGAVRDYSHLRAVLLGPGGGDSPVDDAAVLGEAEVTLRSIVGRAGDVAAVAAIAARREGDRAGRAAAGEAILRLRDQERVLRETASAALRWAAARDPASAERLRACADRLHQVTARAERAGAG